jgi:hypothetical protein
MNMNRNMYRTGFAAMAAVLLLSGCADMFQEKILMSMDRKTGSLGDIFPGKEPDKVVALLPPSQVEVEDRESAIEIRISWSSVTDALYYSIYRAAVSEGMDGTYPEPVDDDFSPICEDGTTTPRQFYSTSYTDHILNSPKIDSAEYKQKYYYRVSAGNTDVQPSKVSSSDPKWGRLLPSAKDLKATKGTEDGKIKISWELVEKAIRYEIHRHDFGGTWASVLGSQNEYKDEIDIDDAGEDFTYYVVAISKSGQPSIRSNEDSGFSAVFGSPTAPLNVRTKSGTLGTSTTKIEIEWDASPLPAGVTAIKYVIHRQNMSNGSKLDPPPEITAAGVTSYVDTSSLLPGVYYEYRVQAVDVSNAKNKSPLPDNLALKAFVLSPPALTEADKTFSSNVTLRWSAALNSDVTPITYSYKIETASSSSGPWSYLTTKTSSSADTIVTTDIAVPAAVYRIIAVNVNGSHESNPGKPFAVLPGKPVTMVSAGQYIPGIASGYTPNGDGVYPVVLKWTNLKGDQFITYEVWRKESKTGSPSKLSIAPDTGNELTHLDLDSRMIGKKYYYYVRAVNALGQEITTDTFTGYGALTPERFFEEYNKTVKSSHGKLTLMHKSPDTSKIGSESKTGTVPGGSVAYNATLVSGGLGGARIIMTYSSYADFYSQDDPNEAYFTITGNSNTSANMSSNGSMDGTMTAVGMYSGTVVYDGITISGGSAGGGTYGITIPGQGTKQIPYNTPGS